MKRRRNFKNMFIMMLCYVVLCYVMLYYVILCCYITYLCNYCLCLTLTYKNRLYFLKQTFVGSLYKTHAMTLPSGQWSKLSS